MTDEYLFFGQLTVDSGLKEIAPAIDSCSWLELRKSDSDGGYYLHQAADGQDISLDTDAGQAQSYLFSGSIDGTGEHVRGLLSELSDCLSNVEVKHRIEVYDGADNLLTYLHHAWPQKSR